MDFIDLVLKRYSVRKYENRAVEQEKLKYVIEAGRMAPSAGNRQPWYFIILQQSELKEKLIETYKAYPNFSGGDAPILIVICGDHSKSWRRRDGKDHCDIDVTLSIDHMMLAAAEQGLGTCWIGGFDSMQCHKILNLPNHIEVIAYLTLGYPDKEEHTISNKKRKSTDEILFWDVIPNFI